MRLILFLTLLSLPVLTSAQERVGASVAVRPLELPAGVAAPGDVRYLYTVSLELDTFLGMEVIADRRLLSLEVQEPGARRSLRCADPAAPRYARTGMRRRALGPAGTGHDESPSTWSEWIDLREYCSGAALAALDRGAHVTPHYGFARGPRDAWVARTTELTGPDSRSTKELVGEPFDVAARATPTAAPPAARVELADVDRDTQSGLSLRVSVRSGDGQAHRVYLRSDQIRFRVRSALGTHECGLPRETHGTVADFFTRVDARRAATLTLDARIVCHDAFPLSGVYEVTPLVVLPYRAPAPHDRDSLTGDFSGAPAVVRIRRGDRGYVEQLVEDLAPTGGRS